MSVSVDNHQKTLKSVPFSLGSTGTIISGVSGKVLKIYAAKCIVSAAISINFRDGASTNIEAAMPLAANGGYVEAVTPPHFLFKTSLSNGLDMVITGAGTVSGRISYWDDDEA
jgi:hypothetical protein